MCPVGEGWRTEEKEKIANLDRDGMGQNGLCLIGFYNHPLANVDCEWLFLWVSLPNEASLCERLASFWKPVNGSEAPIENGV